MHGLPHQRIGPRDYRLAGDDGGQRRQRHHRQLGPVWLHLEERVGHLVGVAEDERPLPEIVEQQRRKHQRQPGRDDRLAAEMPEVDIERLGARYREEYCAQHDDRHAGMGIEKLDAMRRVQRHQHLWRIGDVQEPGDAENEEPGGHHRPEHRRDPRRAEALHHEQPDQDHHRHRHHPGGEARLDHLEALDRREHGDGRRDDRIAEEQCAADNAQAQDPGGSLGEGIAGQRHQRQRAAFALVVGAQHEDHVFDGDHDGQCPDNQRQQTEHLVLRRRTAGGVQRFAERVEGTGADIAENDAQGAENKNGDIGVRGVAGLIGRPSAGCHAGRSGLRHMPFAHPVSGGRVSTPALQRTQRPNSVERRFC